MTSRKRQAFERRQFLRTASGLLAGAYGATLAWADDLPKNIDPRAISGDTVEPDWRQRLAILAASNASLLEDKPMNRLERWKRTIERRGVDRLPRFYLGTAEFSQSLEGHLNVPLDDILHDRFDIDCRFQNAGCEGKSWEPLYIGPELASYGDGTFENLWGSRQQRVPHRDGRRRCSPSCCKPPWPIGDREVRRPRRPTPGFWIGTSRAFASRPSSYARVAARSWTSESSRPSTPGST
jgi:hypothetical protein